MRFLCVRFRRKTRPTDSWDVPVVALLLLLDCVWLKCGILSGNFVRSVEIVLAFPAFRYSGVAAICLSAYCFARARVFLESKHVWFHGIKFRV